MNDEPNDTREKLEEELFEIVRNILHDGALCEADPTGNYTRKPKWKPDESIVNAWVKVLIPRLDRQAAITERELISKGGFDLGTEQRIIEQDRSIVEYAEKVDALEAENEKLQAKVDAIRKVVCA